MNRVGGAEKRIEANQRRELAAGGGEKRAGGIEPETQRTNARRIVQRQHIVNFVIRLLGENFLTDGTLNQDTSPAVRPAILNRPEKCCPMMRTALQGERCRINGKGVVTLKPFGAYSNETDDPRSAAWSRPTKMGFALPINMDFHAHGLVRRIRCGRRRSSRLKREFVARGRSQICQTVVQIKNESGRHQSAERDGRVAALKPPQRIAADKETCGHVARGDAALAPREREVTAQLAERMFGGQRHGCDWLRHGFSVGYNSHSVNKCLVCQTLLINRRHGLFR